MARWASEKSQAQHLGWTPDEGAWTPCGLWYVPAKSVTINAFKLGCAPCKVALDEWLERGWLVMRPDGQVVCPTRGPLFRLFVRE